MGKPAAFFSPRSSVAPLLLQELDWKKLDEEYNSGCAHKVELSHPAPDWADLLAEAWVQTFRWLYDQGGYTGEVSAPVVRLTGKQLARGVDLGFGDVDYDSADEVLRDYLRRNTWKFAVAKNHHDCVRLSNLMLRKDGSLRPWNEFKREAVFVVGASNRYLQTEYETAVAGGQMSRIWQDGQRDKHIFPYAQFDVVMDGRTSEICAPLNNVICTWDDPRLMYFFPPNHYRCRTTVRRLRNGTPTTNEAWPDFEIPADFKNNAGVTGEIFTKENAYIANTPAEILKQTENFI